MRRKPHDIYEPQDYSVRRTRSLSRPLVHGVAGLAFFSFSGLVVAQMLCGPARISVNVEPGPVAFVPLRPLRLAAAERSLPAIAPLRRADMLDPGYLDNAAPVSFGQNVGLRTAFAARPVAVAAAAEEAVAAPTTEEQAEDATIAAVEAPLPAPRPDDLDVAEAAPEFPLPPARPPGLAIAKRIEPQAAPSRVARAATAPAPQRTAATDGGSFLQKLFGGGGHDPAGPQLAYAAPQDGAVRDYSFGTPAGRSGYDRYTAIYDISARTVILPDGARLEAHSGLGPMMDDPRSEAVRMRGVTPPALYDLTERESLFHGVRALRLTPINSSVHGRSGLLAHTFMLGPSGQSNGCVSFRDYNAFLRAYLRGEVKRLAVVAKL